MGGIGPEFLKEVKDKNDIIDVISSYIQLEKKGNNFWGRCPFHHEKTPSFCVNQAEQFYHCFGCGVSGDAISFVKEIESCDFVDAVKILAQRAKIPVPEFTYDEGKTAELKKKKDRLLQITRETAKFYYANLRTDKAGRHQEYILKRGLEPKTVTKFGLGASLNFYDLPKHLLTKGFSKEEILDSGVCTENNGQLIDAEGGRLIIPIIDGFDEIVAFGGRELVKTDFAKYKNTKETLIFNKSKTLYNLNLLKKEKKAVGIDNIIIVEGYMDTISLYQAGFKNVVASMGTSLTKDQARMLKRYSNNVFISYDGDFAGQKASIRGLELLKDENLNVRVVVLPDEMDPDDVCKKYGYEGYKKLLDEALPLIDFKLAILEREFDITKTEEKRNYIQKALSIIQEADNEATKDDLLKTLRNKTGYSYESLKKDLEKVQDKPTAEIEVVNNDENGNALEKAYRFVLASVLFQTPYAKDFDINSIKFDNNVYQVIATYIAEKKRKNERIRASALFDIFDENTVELNQILDLSCGDQLEGQDAMCYFFDSVKLIRKENLNKQLDELMEECKKETDIETRKKLTIKIQELMSLIKNL